MLYSISSKLWTSVLVGAFALLNPVMVLAQDIRTDRVQFEPGTSRAFVEGSIVGYEIVDYVVNAREGQYMNVSMATDNGGSYFNILEPGETEVAMFNGSTSQNQYEGILPESGDYKVRVYMMRSAARRNEVANYRLEIIITDARGNSSGDRYQRDALVEGTNYNATGDIPCAMTESQPMRSCSFGVTRQGNGTAFVTVTKLDGRTRTLFFENGEFTGYDMSQADPGNFSSQRRGDLSVVYIGTERYEVPDAVIFGD
ncbi:MAG: hypothetical protein VKJ24_08630 [Synechococcales bacterium]|nr:hypothetical protein [Synechococcales bacterium]